MEEWLEREERLSVFIESWATEQTPFLAALERRAREDGVPMIRPQTQRLLQFFLALQRPREILEVGAAVGYSALFLREYAPPGAHVTTIERDGERAREARRNFAAAEVSSAETSSAEPIRLLEGDAAKLLPTLAGPYDLIFMDAAKGQYAGFFPEVLRLLAPGGVLVSDNILQDGDILESRYAVTRRNRTIHRRMREYLELLMETPELRTVLLGTGDGAALSVRRGRGAEEAEGEA
ncbi:O-methyltransferase [Lachnoclostridium sp. Marseille-P6806]|uniref:O-methyltransferase n=1 Tax=Lachnoclostridium sp. Marseille-P6806 TaxID=2364793 RepID=UPI00102FF43B|nr:O-methyltransferase [Lachnoclostridium sp. Marseille-P6806]